MWAGEITCPKCGERGKVAVERVNVEGKPYYYLSIGIYRNAGGRKGI